MDLKILFYIVSFVVDVAFLDVACREREGARKMHQCLAVEGTR